MQDDGWSIYDFRGSGTWPEHWPPVHYRPAGENAYEFKVDTDARHGNLLSGLHGAFLAGLGEHVLAIPLMSRAMQNVTVSYAIDYPGAGSAGKPIFGNLRVKQETGRMLFLSFEMAQDDRCIAHGSGVVRKLPGV
ncbi:hypothetical protein [Croceicoccus naphthovorans]|uniref:Uncharacterized protein n=1 Tax=Croceicoccus naphthovorans TaxID=1348774 RepID=A0A0G3XEE2_9SPHN|nr:hypothetical protein [Croceicoccus naphthovorans]AKM09925.1 hypothetical protein AB433_07930 [Croceicoccus naphthovorans]MBB3990928.1 acyl-coenzyme A thioesterase PaaI-like protein [Croceicoccus naphthovorans]